MFVKLLAVWFLILFTNVMNDLKQSNFIQEMFFTGTYKINQLFLYVWKEVFHQQDLQFYSEFSTHYGAGKGLQPCLLLE